MAWRRTLRVLSALVEVYDRVNRVISLLSDVPLRREAVARAAPLPNPVLDAGCGTGAMAKEALRLRARPEQLVLLDPLPEMLHRSRQGLKEVAGRVMGIFEALPFRPASLGAVLCGFSLRDAANIGRALEELACALRPQGLLVNVDLGKPDGPLRSALLGAYWRFVAPLLAAAVIGARGRLYGELYNTYLRYPRLNELKKLLGLHFEVLWLRTRWLGGVLQLIASRRAQRAYNIRR
ncbi:MAG: hypothetical protein C4339_03490 [Nitrososphaerota archaeon]